MIMDTLLGMQIRRLVNVLRLVERASRISRRLQDGDMLPAHQLLVLALTQSYVRPAL